MTVMSAARSLLTKLQAFCNQPHVEILLLLLVAVIILRLPNFAEPYWYGDEGIYLTIGNAMRQGARLYVDIVDHKTPIIYYLAMVETQFGFRLLLLIWMLATTSLFYYIAWKWLKSLWPVLLASIAFVLLTTLPFLEGNIPNGELFVMGFVLAGAALVLNSRFLDTKSPRKLHLKDVALIAIAGGFFGLGILTKVPALFDLAAFMALGWFYLSYNFLNTQRQQLLKALPKWLSFEVALVAGAVLAIAISAVYFIARGSGEAYLNFGLLYNFHYANNWTLPFTQPWLLFAFTLTGKVLVTAVIGLLLTVSTKWIKPLWPTLVMWVVLALFAGTLSNRPYPHYFMQVVPPVTLLLGYTLKLILDSGKRFKFNRTSSIQIVGTILALLLVAGVWKVLQFGHYPTLSYYSNFAQLMAGRYSPDYYASQFNHLLAENNQVAKILTQHSDRYLFIWGTNPMLYAISDKQPVGRFTVSFHIKDINAFEETLAAVKDRNPYYIVVMRDEQNTWPELNQYLQQNYLPNMQFEHMTLWKQR